MCGIVGAFGKINDYIHAAVDTMLLLDKIRGKDSTGIFGVTPDFVVDHIKTVGEPCWLPYAEYTRGNETKIEFFDSLGHLSPDKELIALIGHNRAATLGKVTDENAHPFDFDNIIGVHNGTFAGHVFKTFKHFQQYDVDSQAMFREISDTSVPEFYEKYDGAQACIAWDKASNRLLVWRNVERPLFFTVAKDKSTVLFASDKTFIEYALARHALFNDFGEILPVLADSLNKLTFDGTSVFNSEEKMKRAPFAQAPLTYAFGYPNGVPASHHGVHENQSFRQVNVRVVVLDDVIDDRDFWYWSNVDKKFTHSLNYSATREEVGGFVRSFNQKLSRWQYYEQTNIRKPKEGAVPMVGTFQRKRIGIEASDPTGKLGVISAWVDTKPGTVPKNSWLSCALAFSKEINRPCVLVYHNNVPYRFQLYPNTITPGLFFCETTKTLWFTSPLMSNGAPLPELCDGLYFARLTKVQNGKKRLGKYFDILDESIPNEPFVPLSFFAEQEEDYEDGIPFGNDDDETDLVAGPGGNVISLEDAKRFVQGKCCAWCQVEIAPRHFSTLSWDHVNKDIVFCSDDCAERDSMSTVGGYYGYH